MVRPYAFKDLTIILGGSLITGFNEAGISIVFPNKKYEPSFDIDGGLTKTENANANFVEITFALNQTAASNQDLQNYYNTGANTDLLVKDNNGNTIYAGAQVYVSKQPDATFSQEQNDRSWMIEGYVVANEGGNN